MSHFHEEQSVSTLVSVDHQFSLLRFCFQCQSAGAPWHYGNTRAALRALASEFVFTLCRQWLRFLSSQSEMVPHLLLSFADHP